MALYILVVFFSSRQAPGTLLGMIIVLLSSYPSTFAWRPRSGHFPNSKAEAKQNKTKICMSASLAEVQEKVHSRGKREDQQRVSDPGFLHLCQGSVAWT